MRSSILGWFSLCIFSYSKSFVLWPLIYRIIPLCIITRPPSPVTITIDQKQLENVKCFKYMGCMLTDDGRCTCEIKSTIAMAKAAFNKKKILLPANWT